MIDGALLGKNQPDLTGICEPDELKLWRAAAAPSGITLFEAKALYVIPLMRQLAEGAILCLDHGPRELPAYVLIADAVETLGRCLTGCRKEGNGSGARLGAGMDRLLHRVGGSVVTSARTYDAEACKDLRNFTTHGGTTPVGDDVLDPQLTRKLINLLGEELTDYWRSLGRDGEPLRDKLAAALIRPLLTDGKAVFVEDMYRIMIRPGATAGGGIVI